MHGRSRVKSASKLRSIGSGVGFFSTGLVVVKSSICTTIYCGLSENRTDLRVLSNLVVDLCIWCWVLLPSSDEQLS